MATEQKGKKITARGQLRAWNLNLHLLREADTHANTLSYLAGSLRVLIFARKSPRSGIGTSYIIESSRASPPHIGGPTRLIDPLQREPC